MSKILTFGEIIWDVYPDKNLIGGAGLNFAAHAARCGAESYIISAMGHDQLGSDALYCIEKFGVRPELLKRCDKPTGQCIVTLNERRIPSYNVLCDVAYDNIILCDNDVAKIKELCFDAIYFGTLIQRSTASRESLRRLVTECNFKERICDLNLRKDCFDGESVLFCLEHATILKISDEEEPTLRQFEYYLPIDSNPKSIATAILQKFSNIKYIIITLGDKGAFVYCADENRYFTIPSSPVKVSSTVGAGDSFIAAWSTSVLSGSTPEAATEKAVKLSGFVVSKSDAIPNYTFQNGIISEL